MKTIAGSLVISILCVCCLSKSGVAEGAVYLAILEDQNQEPDTLAAMHDQVAAMGLQLTRPLQGRLAGLGSLWVLPWGLPLPDAVQAVTSIEGVAGTEDPESGTDGYECIERDAVPPGEVRIEFRPDERAAAADALVALGFALRWTYSYSECWGFLPIEYTVPEAIEAAGAVPGVTQVRPGDMPLPGDIHGDVYMDCRINILDLIGVRNHLNQDPNSPPENAVYDVNWDGSINILDMILVRNNLNTNVCPPLCP